MRWSLPQAALLLATFLASVPPVASDPGTVPQCSDGIDNDPGDDGFEDGGDFPADPDCDTPWDDRERGPACSDHIDNDLDDAVDFVEDPEDPRYEGRDPDCTARDQDSEDPNKPTCDPQHPDLCGGEALCPNPLPPMDLQASRVNGGVLLDWLAPLGADPVAYLVFRSEPPKLGLPGPVLPALLRPAEPLDATSATSYFDQTAQPEGTYVYWVTGAGPGCQTTMSNAVVLEPHIPDLADCLYVEPAEPPEAPKVVGPSLNCLSVTVET